MSKKISLLILDVDGILTNGTLTFDANGEEIKTFHAHDGYGIKQVQQAGIPVAIISGRGSKALDHRLKELNIDHVFTRVSDKLPILLNLSKQLDIPLEEIAYMGDDLPDRDALIAVGYPVTVPNAYEGIKDLAVKITHKKGGEGAVREVCDWILQHD